MGESIRTDFHSHIIPGIDDGSKTIEESMEMLRISVNSGIKRILATPHFHVRRGYTVDTGVLKEKVAELKKRSAEEKIDIEIILGQEVGYNEELLEHFEAGKLLNIGESQYMLIEFPLRDFSTKKALDVIYELQVRGVKPVIAHPERYPRFIREPEVINRFIEEGFLFQLNGGSVDGEFGKDSKKLSEIYLNHNIYSFVGSDGHNGTSRTTAMECCRNTIAKKSQELLLHMDDNAEKLLKGNEVVFSGELIKKSKGIFSFFHKK